MTDEPDFDLRGQEPGPEVPAEPGPGVDDSPWSAPAGPREEPADDTEDEVEEASEDSFPASDPPSYTDSSSTGEEPPKSY